MGMHLNNAVTPPSYIIKTLPRGLDEVFKRALEKDPARRYRSVLDPAPAPSGSRKLVIGLAVLIILLILVLAALVVLYINR